jgi:hypothetical protein
VRSHTWRWLMGVGGCGERSCWEIHLPVKRAVHLQCIVVHCSAVAVVRAVQCAATGVCPSPHLQPFRKEVVEGHEGAAHDGVQHAQRQEGEGVEEGVRGHEEAVPTEGKGHRGKVRHGKRRCRRRGRWHRLAHAVASSGRLRCGTYRSSFSSSWGMLRKLCTSSCLSASFAPITCARTLS